MKFALPFVENAAHRAQRCHFQVDPTWNVDERRPRRWSGDVLDLQALFTRVVGAYSQGTLEDVRDIVARALHDRLVAEVAERDRLNHVLSSRLVEFVSAEIVDSEDRLLGGWRDIRFVSRMVVALLEADGAVLAGDPVQARMLSEVWTLQRSGAGGEARWLVTAMVEDE